MGPPTPTPSDNILALNFSCLPQTESCYKSMVLRAPLPASIPVILTYHWSPRAACPFSSSSFSPRRTEETQRIISGGGGEEGHLGSPGKEAGGGAPAATSIQAPGYLPTPKPL